MRPDVSEFPGGVFLYVSDADAIHRRWKRRAKAPHALEDRDYGRGFGFADNFGTSVGEYACSVVVWLQTAKMK